MTDVSKRTSLIIIALSAALLLGGWALGQGPGGTAKVVGAVAYGLGGVGAIVAIIGSSFRDARRSDRDR